MIAEATRLIRDELGVYVEANRRQGDTITEGDVRLANIANLETDAIGNLDDKVIITSVNIEEESSLKNLSNRVRGPFGNIDYVNPPVYLNLYLLFCVTFDKGDLDAYETALHRLSLIIQFFQAKKVFTVGNSPHSSISTATNIDEEIKTELRLSLELYTLTFEQINHLWGSLGGKQVPFVMYKVRIVKVQERIHVEAPLIEEIENQFTSTIEC